MNKKPTAKELVEKLEDSQDLQNLSNEELTQLREDALTEITRRNDMGEIPDQVKNLSQRYESLGGDRAELVAKINEAESSEVEGEPEAEG